MRTSDFLSPSRPSRVHSPAALTRITIWGHLTKRTIKHANEATCQVELLEVERSPVRKLEIDPILTRFWRPPDVRLEYTPV
jgi:hypothetical protein